MKKLRKVLFVCYANRNRSPTAEYVFKEMVRERGYKVFPDFPIEKCDFRILSAGVHADDYANQLTDELINQFDEVFIFDGIINSSLKNGYSLQNKSLVNLEIPDIYYRNDPVLVSVLRSKLEKYVEG